MSDFQSVGKATAWLNRDYVNQLVK